MICIMSRFVSNDIVGQVMDSVHICLYVSLGRDKPASLTIQVSVITFCHFQLNLKLIVYVFDLLAEK